MTLSTNLPWRATPSRRRLSGAFALACGLLAACLASVPVRAETPSGETEGGETKGASAARLADAAEGADWTELRARIETGVSIDAPQADGTTALHWAAYHDHAKSVEILLDAGASASAPNRYGVLPLSLACLNGSARVVELLLAAGADANAALPGGETVLMTAARTGRVEPVDLLLAKGAKVDAKEHRGQTALLWAVAEGHAPVVARLIEHGADFRSTLPSGFGPIHFAAREGRREVMRVLLSHGADVNEAIDRKRSVPRGPLDGSSPLILAVENGHFDLAYDLLEAGADPDDARSGYSPLHTLSWVRKPGRGDDENGNPPPIGSGRRTSLEFARALVAHGADVNLRVEESAVEKRRTPRGRLGRVGATPFFLAAITADAPFLACLLELGADATIPNADGATPLLAAAGVGTIAPGEDAGTEPEVFDAVRLIVELGADVNAVDENGETAMHGAAYKSVPDVVALLAENGAKVDVWFRENRWGWTPLAIAAGYRVGNFKPSPDTVAAIHRALRAAGVEPPENPAPKRRDGKDY